MCSPTYLAILFITCLLLKLLNVCTPAALQSHSLEIIREPWRGSGWRGKRRGEGYNHVKHCNFSPFFVCGRVTFLFVKELL